MTLLLVSAFICLWAWHFFLKLNQEISTTKYSIWILSLLPVAACIMMVFISWQYLGILVWLLWIISRWLTNKRWTVCVQALACVAVASMGLEFFTQRISLATQAPEPALWIFWLGDTGWFGALLGFAIGCFFTAIHREKGHVWWIAPAMLLSSIGSLGLVWGLFLGDRCQWKNKNKTIFSLVGLAIGAFAMKVYPPGMKDILWLSACLVWICLENLIFHRQAKV